MKLATWNVNGIRARQAHVQEFIEREQPDVLCLQELKAAPEQLPLWLSELEGYWCYWHGGKGYSGVGLHVRKATHPERPAYQHPAFDFEHRIVTARLPHTTVASIYVPNGGKDFPAKIRFLEALDAYAAQFQEAGSPVVLCGDLNVARTDMDVHPKERKPRATGQLPPAEELKARNTARLCVRIPGAWALIDRILARGLVDVHRQLDPDNADLFTWWPPWRELKARNIGWRLDYVFASQALAARATSCMVHRDVGTSDHGPVVAVFDV